MYENDFSFARLFKAYRRILQFTGRSTRTELLGYWVATWLLSVITNYAILFTQQGDPVATPVTAVVNSVILAPAPALAVRRAHDCGWPGAFALLLIVPAVGNFVLKPWLLEFPQVAVTLSVAYLAGLLILFWKPQEGDNAYGPDPRLVDDRYAEEV